MLLSLTWFVAVGAAAFAALLSFAAGRNAAPRFPVQQRLVAAGAAALASALVVATALDHALGVLAALGPALFAAFAWLVALAPLTRRGATLRSVTRDTVRACAGGQRYADSRHNLALTARECEAAAARQRAGESPPAGSATWDEHWRRYEDGLRQWQDNADRHLERVRQARARRP